MRLLRVKFTQNISSIIIIIIIITKRWAFIITNQR